MTSKIMGEAERRWNVARPLTHPLDYGEEGLAMQATQRPCATADCPRDHYARGLCKLHYNRARTDGTLAMKPKGRTCTITGCDRKHRGRGLCNMHLVRLVRYDDPDRDTYRFDSAMRLAARSEWRGECLIYTAGTTQPRGHANFKANGIPATGAHRAIWILTNGPIPDGLVVRHKCDVPRCINVAHLELGTVADNNNDRMIRGRNVVLSGEANGSAKLTVEQAREVKRRLALGHKKVDIANDMAVSRTAIWSIAAGRTWRDA